MPGLNLIHVSKMGPTGQYRRSSQGRVHNGALVELMQRDIRAWRNKSQPKMNIYAIHVITQVAQGCDLKLYYFKLTTDMTQA